MRVLPIFFKFWPWVDLDLFNVKVKFGYIGFCMEESEFFFKTIAALVSIKGQGHSLALVKGHSDFKVKCLTLACILR